MKLKTAIISLAMFATTAYAGETFFSVDVRPGAYMAQKRDFDRVRDDLDMIESILNSTDNLGHED